MSRIIAGSAGGRTLTVPKRGTRPTSDRVREALFSRLEHLDLIEGAAVVDLFAGSGALALEAISRGAARAVLVDSARPAIQAIRANIIALGMSDVVAVISDKAQRAAAALPPGPWDLIFLDPPYDLSDADLDDVLARLDESGALAEEAVIVIERRKRSNEPTWPRGWEVFDERTYGDTTLWFAER